MLRKDIIRKMIEDQWQITKTIWSNKGIRRGNVAKDRLGLLVKLGELANQVNSWKYWKKGKFTDKDKAAEKLGECIAFILVLIKENNRFNLVKLDSRLTEIAYKITETENRCKSKDISFLDGQEVSMLLDAIYYLTVNELYNTAIIKLFEIGFLLDINFEGIVKAYYKEREKVLEKIEVRV
ncbi:dUTP diphosphatase [Clostridium perfringens]|uniref:dUTP diphosphatase n=1 Tax=Clostridium perfringens TaxID=1502 RepID=UPI0032D9FA66